MQSCKEALEGIASISLGRYQGKCADTELETATGNNAMQELKRILRTVTYKYTYMSNNKMSQSK